MSIIDVVIFIILIIGVLAGVRKGAIRSLISLAGFILVIVISFQLKNVVANIFYSNLPFFEFKIFKGVFVFNILFYEIIAFLLVFGFLFIFLKLIIKVTKVLEKVLDATVILGLGSRILGAIICFIESYVIVFILLFILNQPFINIKGMEDSKLNKKILNTPVLTMLIKENREAVDELIKLKDLYDNSNDINEYNYDSLDILLKYNIISVDSVKTLQGKDKLKIKNLNRLIMKYGG